jgi:hypothetical protein
MTRIATVHDAGCRLLARADAGRDKPCPYKLFRVE